MATSQNMVSAGSATCATQTSTSAAVSALIYGIRMSREAGGALDVTPIFWYVRKTAGRRHDMDSRAGAMSTDRGGRPGWKLELKIVVRKPADRNADRHTAFEDDPIETNKNRST